MKHAVFPLLVTSSLVLAASVAQAQVSFGPRVGLNASQFTYNADNIDARSESKLLLGPQVGITLNAQLGHLALQPSLLVTMKGEKNEESQTFSDAFGSSSYEYKTTTRLTYAELPVNLVYSTKGAEGGFQVFAGPYLAYGLRGKSKSTITETITTNGQTRTETDSNEADVKFAGQQGDDREKTYVRGLDAGFNFGLGYQVGGVQAQLGYGLGLGNLVPDSEDGRSPQLKVRNRGVQLSLAYFFK